ncbi:MAG: hypothetical protein K2J10_06245 [Muribaculaceae bacterium]|nr:hypothetical protein [Muribaculaceae bacterium]
MKILKFNIIALALAIVTLGFTACSEADPEFVHTDNFISAMVCMNGRTNDASSINGIIYEYDKNNQLLEKGFTPEEAEGGSGVIMFVVSQEEREDFDLTRVYLRATLTWDESITPTLSGLQNIDPVERPEGMVIGVKSGVGKVRKYRIMGVYE